MTYQTVITSIKDEAAKACLDLGLIGADDFDKFNQHAKNTGDSLFDLILKDGVVSDERLLKGLEKKYGVACAIDAIAIEPDFKNFPYKFCYKNGLIPIGDDGITLVIGVIAPSGLNSIKNLTLLTGRKVSAKFVPLNLIVRELMKQGDGQDETELKDSDVITELADEKILISEPEVPVQVIPQQVLQKTKSAKKNFDSSNIVTAVEDVLSQAVDSGVSDIHFEVFRDTANIRFRKNGTLISAAEYKKFVTENYVAVVARIKILANLDIAEKRLPQDGKIAFKSKGGNEVDFRVSVLPTNLGERIVIRILNSNSLAVSIDGLGFKERQLQDFLDAIDAPQGLVLVTGPTGSGKSTTLYGAIHYLNKPDVNILTAEDPVEYTLSGISQVQVRENIGLTFANALRSFLRQDPEIILVGEIRDTETADIATKAALTGHLVLSTLHTNSAVGAITRLVNMGLPEYLVSSALTLVVAQRLIRINCKNCLEPYEIGAAGKLDHQLADALKGMKPMHGKGCVSCSYTGYSGRKAIHEVLKVSPRIQKAINHKATEAEMQSIALEEGFESMSSAAIRYIASGDLSIEEYLRVVPQNDEQESDS